MQLNWMTPALKLRPFPQKSALTRRRIKRRLPRSSRRATRTVPAGRTTRETLEDGTSTIDYAYQTVGSLVTQTTVTDPLGRQTEYRFNGQQRPKGSVSN